MLGFIKKVSCHCKSGQIAWKRTQPNISSVSIATISTYVTLYLVTRKLRIGSKTAKIWYQKDQSQRSQLLMLLLLSLSSIADTFNYFWIISSADDDDVDSNIGHHPTSLPTKLTNNNFLEIVKMYPCLIGVPRWRLVGGTTQAEKLSRTKYFVDDMSLIFVRYQTTFYRQNHRLKRDSNLDRQSR